MAEKTFPPKIRRENTANVEVSVFAGDNPRDLRGLDLAVFLIGPYDTRRRIVDFELVDAAPYNIVKMTLQGRDLGDVGVYSVVIYENPGNLDQQVVDSKLFELVPSSELEDSVSDGLVEKKVDLTIKGVLIGGRDGYTPVKGVDYFTEADIADIKREIESSLGLDWATTEDIDEICV